MWGALGRAWIDHLDTVHQKSKCTTSPVTLESLKDRVRLIHAMKPETLRIHHHYFHDDLDAVLHKATIQSLQTYIQHYLPAIIRSIDLRHAQQINSQAPVITPNIPGPTHLPLHHAQEEPPHRKHSRRRIGISGGG